MKTYRISYIGMVCWYFIFTHQTQTLAQNRPSESVIQSPSTSLWLGTYGRFRLGEKLYWDAQFHYRTNEFEGTPYVGRLAQIYNRHGLNYMVTPNFSVTLGPVLRLNFNQNPDNPDFTTLRLEPRIWHEYLFSMPFKRFTLFHRLRLEHRWSIGNAKDADWIYRDRWRYKILANIPLNTPTMQPGTFFFTPDVEIIMQSGSPVIDSPLEDLRINPTIGYIVNPRVKYTASMMYTTGQQLNRGWEYNSRWVMRLNVYISLDFRKFEEKVQQTRIED